MTHTVWLLTSNCSRSPDLPFNGSIWQRRSYSEQKSTQEMTVSPTFSASSRALYTNIYCSCNHTGNMRWLRSVSQTCTVYVTSLFSWQLFDFFCLITQMPWIRNSAVEQSDINDYSSQVQQWKQYFSLKATYITFSKYWHCKKVQLSEITSKCNQR